jgi:hypothetical protein
MFRKAILGMAVLLVGGSVLLAENYMGKLDKMDADKNTGLVRDKDNSPHPFKCDASTKFVDKDGKDLKDGFKGFGVGDEVSVTTEGKGKKTMTKEVKLIKKGSAQ